LPIKTVPYPFDMIHVQNNKIRLKNVNLEERNFLVAICLRLAQSGRHVKRIAKYY